MVDRRAFLTFLAGSPLLAAFPNLSAFAQATPGGLEQAAHALDVFDFEAAAQKIVPPAHWGYLMSGVDGEVTLRENRAAFERPSEMCFAFEALSHSHRSPNTLGHLIPSFQPASHRRLQIPVFQASGRAMPTKDCAGPPAGLLQIDVSPS